jgi:hypothetical protein
MGKLRCRAISVAPRSYTKQKPDTEYLESGGFFSTVGNRLRCLMHWDMLTTFILYQIHILIANICLPLDI